MSNTDPTKKTGENPGALYGQASELFLFLIAFFIKIFYDVVAILDLRSASQSQSG